jgi:hypothetical protein
MTSRTNLRAGKLATNHSEAFQVRTALKAGGIGATNHNEALRSTLKAGGLGATNHNEKLVRVSERQTVSMRRELLTTSRKHDRLDLLVVRAGLRVGRARGRYRK